ncbi:MAG: nitrophenyl compound nitroreductase subunit ArsF family protein [Ignavibacteriota bacterium]|nr:nitrophenyl compound nitroreductase subunit ArsF family protein [Ignavibacteriota bacterium]
MPIEKREVHHKGHRVHRALSDTKDFIIILFVIIISLLFSSCSKEKILGTNDITYTVYYFHPTARCESCINIENFTKELITTKYTTPLAMKYVALNIEDKENEHFRKDFNLKFSSVVIVKSKKGETEKYKNLDSIWTYSENKFNFFNYTDREIQSFLK